MCGIFGYFDRGGHSLPAATLQAMASVLVHRGPDDQGVHAADGAAIGNTRLSIIDVAHGHQPFLSDDGQVAVVQNGEIYNYVELMQELERDGRPCRTRSDTEVLLRLYERDGIDFVHRLNGMFAIAIHDKRENALYLVRDRIGVKPLYVHDDGRRLLFASEIKALLAAGAPRRTSLAALDHFLTFNYVPPPFTIFEGIRHLMPGHRLRINRDGVETRQWWNLAQIRPEQRSEGAWIDEFSATLDDAVRLRLRADVPFGAFLSGGVDSSTVVGLMARHMSRPVDTFCIGFHEPAYDESPFAMEAAERFQTRHTVEKVEANMLDLWPLATYYCDQPHGDISFLPTYRVARLAVKQAKMVLTGDGGDELFAGYTKYRDFFGDTGRADLPEESFRQAYLQNISLFSDREKADLYTQAFADGAGQAGAYDILEPLYCESAHMDRVNQALFIDTRLLLPGNNLVKPDRMGMAVSLEARTPFLDYRMVELAFRMPGDLKLREGETKYLYKKAVAPLIGESLAYRRKQMFTVPVGDWFKGEMAPWCREMLLSQRARDRGLFRPRRVEQLLSEHQGGRCNHTREIRALIAVEVWHRVFLDGDIPSLPATRAH